MDKYLKEKIIQNEIMEKGKWILNVNKNQQMKKLIVSYLWEEVKTLTFLLRKN